MQYPLIQANYLIIDKASIKHTRRLGAEIINEIWSYDKEENRTDAKASNVKEYHLKTSKVAL